jgi:type I restriction enzyme M protein
MRHRRTEFLPLWWGVGARIKEQLIKDCNLHTIVRLPEGAFEPYTSIPSNLLFFDKTGPTREIWFYETSPPDGRKKYSKTKPMRFEDLAECQAWWSRRVANQKAWRVPVTSLDNDLNLDLHNPNRDNGLAHRPPHELLAELLTTERDILQLTENLQIEMEKMP